MNRDDEKGRLEAIRRPLVYVPMAADIVHPGHINILNTAVKYGFVMVGLFSDEAIKSYKRTPLMCYDQRRSVVESLKPVMYVVRQQTCDYADNLNRFRPEFMVHGNDWKIGLLADVRQKAIELMAEWGGKVVEPSYTKGISSTKFYKMIATEKD